MDAAIAVALKLLAGSCFVNAFEFNEYSSPIVTTHNTQPNTKPIFMHHKFKMAYKSVIHVNCGILEFNEHFY